MNPARVFLGEVQNRVWPKDATLSSSLSSTTCKLLKHWLLASGYLRSITIPIVLTLQHCPSSFYAVWSLSSLAGLLGLYKFTGFSGVAISDEKTALMLTDKISNFPRLLECHKINQSSTLAGRASRRQFAHRLGCLMALLILSDDQFVVKTFKNHEFSMCSLFDNFSVLQYNNTRCVLYCW